MSYHGANVLPKHSNYIAEQIPNYGKGEPEKLFNVRRCSISAVGHRVFVMPAIL